ncbi:hypothetical protein SDC9_121355 [bioreactor metagenome]|uniref:Uncharacterized protein n=1 Tax=bioreactor metagenome TaxID=1076179 RepID=A0A645CBQ0_9ZZZZ
MIVVNLYLSILITKLQAKLYVLRKRSRLLLGQGSHNRKKQLTTSFQRINVFFFKNNSYVLFFELPYILQAVNGVSCKSADGLGNNHINFTGHAILNHTVEAFTFLSVGAGNTIIGINTCELPFFISSNIIGVMLHLYFIATSLFIAVSTYSTVRCDL